MTLHIAPGFSLPDDVVTETIAILAVKRAGKSNAAVVLAEEMYKQGLPWVAVDPKGDWWGVRAAGDGDNPGLSVLVFGGLHGDVPLEPTGGRLVADIIVDQGVTAVLDVSEMTKADQRRFLVDFADRLYRTNREPRMVFCEEADEYIPQRVVGETAKLVGAFETLVKRGGFRGLGCCLITQRSASLNKDVLTQIETLITMRTPSPQDRKAILGWVETHAAGADVVAELPALENGEAWVFSPQWLKTLEKIRFRRRETFDSGATPKVGVKPRRPTKLADVDLDSIKAAMADTIERAQADDPTALRKRIAELERALAQRAPASEPEIKLVEVPAVSEEMRDQFLDALLNVVQASSEVQHLVGPVLKALQPPAAPLPTIAEQQRVFNEKVKPAKAVESKPRRTPVTSSPDQVELRKGARRMVEALAAMAPLRLTKSQWGTVAKLKTSGGTWSTYMGDIRRAGLLDENDAGYTLTDAGFEYLGSERPAKMTGADLQDHYRRILRAGASKMLGALIDAYPIALTKEELGDAAGIAISGGTFSTYLGDLTRNGLAERRDGRIVATDILIHGANL